jgi:Ion channel
VEAVYIFLVVPLGMLFPVLSVLLSSLVVLVMAGAIIILGANRAVMLLVVAPIVLSQVAGLTSNLHPIQVAWLEAGSKLMAIVALTWLVAINVFGPGRVTSHRIRGAIVLYLNVAVGFGAVYELAASLLPNAFAGQLSGTSPPELRAGLLYFSFTTLTTAGYRDITPIQPFVRSLANLESVMGELYPATLLARIVTLAMQGERRER